MSNIPDTTKPYDSMSEMFGKYRLNYYYEGILNIEAQARLAEYDFGIENTINALDWCLEECIFQEYLEPENEVEEIQINDTVELLSDNTSSSAFRQMVLDHALLGRNEYVVSMIDSGWVDEVKAKQMEEDFKNLTKGEFLEKYPIIEFDEWGRKVEREEGCQEAN